MKSPTRQSRRSAVAGDERCWVGGAIGAFVGVGILFWAVYFTGTKAERRRLNERDDF